MSAGSVLCASPSEAVSKNTAVLPAGGSPGGGGVPGHSSSLPELQCFISDSQLTRDAALHLGLGDMEEPPAALDVCCATHGCVWLFCQASRLQDR